MALDRLLSDPPTPAQLRQGRNAIAEYLLNPRPGCGARGKRRERYPLVQDGELLLDFHRDGRNFDDAVKSAMSSVEQAGGHVVKVDPLPD